MIIIKIIFLYFIEIAHTDDFPLTGTRLVYIMLEMTAMGECVLIWGEVQAFGKGGGSQGVHENAGSRGVHENGGSREPCEPCEPHWLRACLCRGEADLLVTPMHGYSCDSFPLVTIVGLLSPLFVLLCLSQISVHTILPSYL